MVATPNHDINGQLNIKLLGQFRLQGNRLKLQAAIEPHLCDIFQQARNLTVFRQLFQQTAETLLDLCQLLLIGFQVSGTIRFFLILLAQRNLLRLYPFQAYLKIFQMKLIAQQQQHDKNQHTNNCLECARPGTNIVEVQVI